MALPRDYAQQSCSLARSLEVVGERWTLLMVRDAFFGVRRFGDFVSHLGIPRAVLTDRLKSLTSAKVLIRVAGSGRRAEYQLTKKGISLWPVICTLVAWGEEYYAPQGPRRIFYHVGDEGLLDHTGRCSHCAATVAAEDTVVAPGPGLARPSEVDDPVTAALARPHRLLRPLST